jgi:hypothetical protein
MNTINSIKPIWHAINKQTTESLKNKKKSHNL